MDDIEKIIWFEGLKNAVKFNGKANAKAIMGKLMRDKPELRKKGKEVKPLIFAIIDEINDMDLENQKKKVLSIDPHALDIKAKKGPQKKVLPELPGAKQGEVVMRLAPYPSGALHIGNARMVVLNDEYVKKYNGKLLLVYDDTIGTTKAKMNEPSAKYVIPEAYDMIKEGLEWLGVKYHDTIYKSDRVEIYQDEAGKLVEKGNAYVCTCEPQEFRDKYKKLGKECPCRNKGVEYHLEMYDQMKEGKIDEGGAVVRLKTGMDQKDPALRDHIMMRISDAPHPRIGTKVRLWPVLDWSWGLDDHLLGVTHIIRGNDLRKEGEIEKIIWDTYGWKHSHITLYGRLKFDDEFMLSKTLARRKVSSGEYEGWSDPRTWSLQSLNVRGIQPQAVREALLDLGLSKRGIIFDKDWIYSKNKTLIDSTSNRYWFVENPLMLNIDNIPTDDIIAKPLLHPKFPKKGTREIPLGVKDGCTSVYLAKDDLDVVKNEKGKVLHPALTAGSSVRLKDLFNISINNVGDTVETSYLSQEMEKKIRKIQVVPAKNNIKINVLQPNGIVTEGFGEVNLKGLDVGSIVQFERYGYVKLMKISDDQIFGYYTN